jgi:hypothetical protein
LLGNSFGFYQGIDNNPIPSFQGWAYAGTAVTPLSQYYINRPIGLPGRPRGTLTIEDKDVLQLEQILTEMQEHLKILATANVESEMPEVFQLQPLARTRISVTIEKVEPAQFYYAGDGEFNTEDIEG